MVKWIRVGINTRDNHWLLKDPRLSLMETKSSQAVQFPTEDAPDKISKGT